MKRVILFFVLINTPQLTLSNDGFMQDFFNRFPHLPFGNMNSFKHLHDTGSMAVTDSLIPAGDDFPFRNSERSYFKSVSYESKSTTLPRIIATTTIKPVTPKKKLFSRKKLFEKKSSKPTVSSLPRLKSKSKYENFKIVSTTPAYGQVLPKFGTSKIKELRQSFFSYSDQYNSRHHLYPQDEDFNTQLLRPHVMGDSHYNSYDPFLQTPLSDPSSTTKESSLEKHFYYGDTTTMKPHKYKVRMRAKKKGIVINEKAVSGEVHKSINMNEVLDEDEEDHTATTVPPPTSTTTKSTTTTTTLPPSSVSEIPKMKVSEMPSVKTSSKYHYKLTPTTKPARKRLFFPAESPPQMFYSPLSYSQYDFEGFMPTPHLPRSPAVTQSPKLKYSYSYTTTKTPKSPEQSSVIVMPPFTPLPNTSSTSSSSSDTTDRKTVAKEKHGVYFIPRYHYPDYTHLHHKHPLTNNSLTPELRTVDDNHLEDITEDEDKTGDKDVRKYSYKVMGGHVEDVRGLRPLPETRVNDKYLYRPPPPLLYYSPPPRGLPPVSHHHDSPYPYHVYHVEEPPRTPPTTTYHSRIKYKSNDDEDHENDVKPSSQVEVDGEAPRKFLPHDKIIKATFFEDNNLSDDIIDSTKSAITLSKSPKLLRSRYSVDNQIDSRDEDNLFKRNLNQIMRRQFHIQPSQLLSGFSPLHQHSERVETSGETLLKNRNLDNDAVNIGAKQRTTTSVSEQLTNNGIDNMKLEREQDLVNNNVDDIEDGNEKKESKHLLSNILQNYKSREIKRNFQHQKFLSPIQSIKENLFARFLKYFRRKPKSVKIQTTTTTAATTTTSTEDPMPSTTTTAMKGVDMRLPQNFIGDFSRKTKPDYRPPSSQDSYRNFLRKLKKNQSLGRNES